MIPTLISLGPVGIHSFGLMIVLALLAAWQVLYHRLQESGENPEVAEKLIFRAAIGGVVGARVWYLFSFPEQFLNDPLSAIFSGGGFIFYGGFVGGALAVILTLRANKLSITKYTDLSSVPIAIGYAIGRVGCQLSGDGDYGIPSSVPWAMSYSEGVIPTPIGVNVHPTPVYETLMAFAIGFILLRFERRGKLATGQLFAIYLFLSSLARLLVEFVRVEPVVGAGLTQAQFFALGIMLFAGVIWINARGSRRRVS